MHEAEVIWSLKRLALWALRHPNQADVAGECSLRRWRAGNLQIWSIKALAKQASPFPNSVKGVGFPAMCCAAMRAAMACGAMVRSADSGFGVLFYMPVRAMVARPRSAGTLADTTCARAQNPDEPEPAVAAVAAVESPPAAPADKAPPSLAPLPSAPLVPPSALPAATATAAPLAQPVQKPARHEDAPAGGDNAVAERLTAQTARADAADAERARLADRVAELERAGCRLRAQTREVTEIAVTQTARAEAAEAEQTRLADRVAELKRALHDKQRSKRAADMQIAELSAAVAVKRERLSEATATAAKAVAKADAAARELDDALTCRLCMAAPREMLYQPCLHLAICSGCNDDQVRLAVDKLSVAARRKGQAAKPPCPICRTKADRITGPVFMP